MAHRVSRERGKDIDFVTERGGECRHPLARHRPDFWLAPAEQAASLDTFGRRFRAPVSLPLAQKGRKKQKQKTISAMELEVEDEA